MVRQLTSGFRDVYDAAEQMRRGHSALEHAINGTNSAYYSQLDIINQVMTMAPEKLALMFDETGALLEMEHAVDMVTEAHIELLTIQQKVALLDMVTFLDDETDSIRVQMGAVDNLADSYWGLFHARMAALSAGVDAGTVSAGDYAAISNMMSQLGQMGERARSGSRGGGGPRRTPNVVGTGRGSAMLVSDPANDEIRGELVRLMEDVSRHRYLGAAYQNTPIGGVAISPGAIVVNGVTGMDEKRLAELVGERTCQMVAEQMQSASRSYLS